MPSVDPSRLIGMEDFIFAMYAGPSPLSPSVAMFPGKTALIVTPNGASSMAAVRMKPSCPALLAP
jgi:hypothetical protein